MDESATVEALISRIMADDAMPEHMVTRVDEREMRRLLRRHLTHVTTALEQVTLVERSMAGNALEAWSAANARSGLADHDALLVHADALTRWSERLRLALAGDLYADGDSWVRP